MFSISTIKHLFILGTAVTASVIAAESAIAVSTFGINNDVKKFTATDNEDTLISDGVAVVSNGNTNVYIGTNQVNNNNQDPILTSFTNGTRDWVFTDIETTGADARGIALLWDGNNDLYAAFTTDGTQGDASNDFRRFTTNGWLNSYGQGGGAKATVLLKIELDRINSSDPNNITGVINNGTFVSALLSNGKTNTLVPTNMSFSGTELVLEAQSFFAPRNTDAERMTQTTSGISSPFDYTITFNDSLTQANSAISPGWDNTPVSAAVPFEFKSSLGLLLSLITWGIVTKKE
ncbi:conserved exported hypothetical protein [Hyella patelloides LEGE 07179]|uniref:PEP-CTERM sorting domain-containing protein n=1 Tax=Hyella patelloides LEGE 07179 TaxID=945734 RepID=A0A563VLH5_9CYAN|nr:hypothetical protein [Hyella patelloides]VEP12271.1 conserved exported hypothetical protein [Hyella patelloides LEGE 07179]